jgi:hypothetical protein
MTAKKKRKKSSGKEEPPATQEPTEPGALPTGRLQPRGRAIAVGLLMDAVTAVWTSGAYDSDADKPGIDLSRLDPIDPGSRVVLAGRVADVLNRVYNTTLRHPEDGGHWVIPILETGSMALIVAAASFLAEPDLGTLENNTLSEIGRRVSELIRRTILLDELEATGWNLSLTAERLRMGSNAQPVIREIKRLGLTEEYEQARESGRVERSGHKSRKVDKPPRPE